MTATRFLSALFLVAISIIPSLTSAATPVTQNGVTTIHLDEYNGYFAAQETLAGLKPGKYEFIISNKTNKMVGFWLQDGKTHEFLDKFPLKAGQTRRTTVTITDNGFRYRCPINPTSWYDVGVGE